MSLAKRKIGILTNQNVLTQDYKISAYALKEKLGNAIKCILSPEHGWSGFIAEGVKIDHGFDPILELPIFSLYGGNKKSLEFIKENIDVLLIDLQDVGLRCYTYAATCAKVFEKCVGSDIEIIICDRPNPLGSKVRDPGLEPDYRSLVSYLDVPFQHGQTMGQLLSVHNKAHGNLPLTVIPCEPYCQPWESAWVPPSPNLPSWEAVLLYPALVFLEGTNVSEGRGTSLPFTCLGAPGLDSKKFVSFLNQEDHQGIRARPLVFTPQSSKFKGKECQGVHLLITDASKLEAFSLGINILHFLKEKYADFKWEKMTNKKEAYFIDYLYGTDSVRKALDKGVPASQVLERFK